MKIYDFFAGQGGELRRPEIERLGHEYITLDIDPKFHCDITADIMSITDISDLGQPDFIWSSPPCETWSVASIGHHWNIDNTPKTKEAAYMVLLVQHTLELMNAHAKIAWVMENPRGKLRKIPFMQQYPRDTVTYCQYGETRMKPTDIWHVGLNWTPRFMCKNGNPCHVAAPRGSRTGTQGFGTSAEKSVVPLALWLEILEAVQNE
jgi:hypothetical protein